MSHTRGRPYHPQTQGKIERGHRTMKAVVRLENYYERHGWGTRFDAQVAESRAAIAGYAAKLCAEIDEASGRRLAGEATKGSQVPELLPRHCRSFGQSHRFIPGRKTSGEWTGWLEDADGRAVVKPRLTEAELQLSLDELVHRRPLRGTGPVFCRRNPLARWDTADDAFRYARSEYLTGDSVRTYRLDKKVERRAIDRRATDPASEP